MAAADPGPSGTLRLTGAQALVRLLEAEAVPFAFGIVGGKLAPLLKALSTSTIRFVGVRHEAAGPMMAAAIHASTGRVAVALGEMGPGTLNLAAGMASPPTITWRRCGSPPTSTAPRSTRTAACSWTWTAARCWRR